MVGACHFARELGSGRGEGVGVERVQRPRGVRAAVNAGGGIVAGRGLFMTLNQRRARWPNLLLLTRRRSATASWSASAARPSASPALKAADEEAGEGVFSALGLRDRGADSDSDLSTR